MAQYAKKSTAVSAIQWRGDNKKEVQHFIYSNIFHDEVTDELLTFRNGPPLRIPVNYWVMEDADNRLSVLSDEDFHRTYTLLHDQPMLVDWDAAVEAAKAQGIDIVDPHKVELAKKLVETLEKLADQHGATQVYGWAFAKVFHLPPKTDVEEFKRKLVFSADADLLKHAIRQAGGKVPRNPFGD